MHFISWGKNKSVSLCQNFHSIWIYLANNFWCSDLINLKAMLILARETGSKYWVYLSPFLALSSQRILYSLWNVNASRFLRISMLYWLFPFWVFKVHLLIVASSTNWTCFHLIYMKLLLYHFKDGETEHVDMFHWCISCNLTLQVIGLGKN